MRFYGVVICLCASFLSSCNANEILDFKVRNWTFDLDDSLSDRGIYFLGVNNVKDLSQIGIGERNNKITSVTTIVEKGDNVGVQYQRENNNIEYVKVGASFDRRENDESYIKLFRNKNGNWMLVEYADRSEKKILRQAELK